MTMTGPVFVEVAPSHTEGRDVFLIVRTEFLGQAMGCLLLMVFWHLEPQQLRLPGLWNAWAPLLLA